MRMQFANSGLMLLLMLRVMQTVDSHLHYNFYRNTCEYAEKAVAKVVRQAVRQNPGLGAGLLRMHFHDCFVNGCDASVLVDSTPGHLAEKDSPINNPSLRGFKVIDDAKSLLEGICPGVVSCADILAFAARDSVHKLGGPSWMIRSGRRDGNVSKASDVILNLPSPFFNLQQLTINFAAKGLSQDEMITLSGAHTVGGSHCTSFSRRLYHYNSTTPQDPELNEQFAKKLKLQCPLVNFDPNLRVGMDSLTPNKFDNKYFTDLKFGRGLFTSDEALFTDDQSSAAIVRSFDKHKSLFKKKFVKAMIKMSEIEVQTGLEGNIRRNCRVF